MLAIQNIHSSPIGQRLTHDVAATSILFTLTIPTISVANEEQRSSMRMNKKRGGAPERLIMKKSVSFSPQIAQVSHVLHSSEMTEEEKHATYYTRRDYDRIEEENEAVMERMYRTNKYIDTDTHFYRGLEIFLPMEMRKRKIRINFVVSNVLREQESNGIIGSGWIQTFSKNYYAFQSSEKARINGWWDRIRADA